MHETATLRLFEVNGETTQFPVYVNLTRMFPRGDIPKLAKACLEAPRTAQPTPARSGD